MVAASWEGVGIPKNRLAQEARESCHRYIADGLNSVWVDTVTSFRAEEEALRPKEVTEEMVTAYLIAEQENMTGSVRDRARAGLEAAWKVRMGQ
jgi:hypothetical protein